MSILRSKQMSGSLDVTSSWAVTASYAINGGGTSVSYITASGPYSLTGIEVADYSNDVAVTFLNNTLKFIFGTPLSQSITSFTFNGTFETDRFNQELYPYTASGIWANNGYTLISASIATGSVILTSVGSGTTLDYKTTTSGSQSYTLYVTASSPLDSSIRVVSQSLAGTLNKINPVNPTQTKTAAIQLGVASNQIEQGATGSILISAITGSANRWTITSFTTTGSFGSTTVPLLGNTNGAAGSNTFFVTGSATGSNSITITTTARYTSGILNIPATTATITDTITYSKIRSLRYGASSDTSFTQTQLEDLALWDINNLGGSIGTIAKGTLNPSGQSISITWSGNKYQYIVYSTAYNNLTAINTQTGNVLDGNTFPTTPTTVGSYKVYRTVNSQAGGAGTTQPYTLVI